MGIGENKLLAWVCACVQGVESGYSGMDEGEQSDGDKASGGILRQTTVGYRWKTSKAYAAHHLAGTS